MNKYLQNLALIHLTNKATELNLHSPKGSYITKTPRKEIYTLTEQTTNRPILTVQFFTNQTPNYIIN